MSGHGISRIIVMNINHNLKSPFLFVPRTEHEKQIISREAEDEEEKGR
jgi:hypothetical protein